ncbi:MAG: DUF3299 domain-containing protein [Desulfovibrio sp.]|nr:DUF3299 domain-containing protein [Desulfovibrio sp.]
MKTPFGVWPHWLVLLSLVGCFLLLPARLWAEPRTVSWADLLPRDQALALKGAVNSSLQGQEIVLKGFVVPLERDADNNLCEFLLVPYFGACIHVPPPPANQIVHVRLPRAAKGIETMDVASVTGRLSVDSEDGQAGYELENADLVREKAESGREVKAWFLTLLCGISVCLGWIGPFAGRRLSADLSCLGMSVACGMLMGLGIAALVANFALASCIAFGSLLLLIVWLMRRHRHGGKAQNELAVAAGLGLHNFPECFFVLTLTLSNGPMGFALALAMLAHNIPVGISLAMGFTKSSRAYTCSLLAGILPPLLAIAAHAFVRAYVTPEGMRLLMAAAGGVLFALACAELLPTALALGKPKRVVWGIAFGFLLLFVIMLTLYLGLF